MAELTFPGIQRTTTPPARRTPWGIGEIAVAAFFPLLLVSLVFAYSVTAEPSEEEFTDADVIAGVIVNTIVVDGGLLLLVGGLAMLRCGASAADLGLRPVRPLSHLWMAPALVVAAFIVVIAYTLALESFGLTPEQDIDALVQSPAVLPLTGFTVVIVAPLVEEIFFRGFVYGGLAGRVGWIPAAALSGLMFGAVHGMDPNAMLLAPPFAAIGAAFAWAYYRAGSLWVSIAAHFLFNTVSFSLLAMESLT